MKRKLGQQERTLREVHSMYSDTVYEDECSNSNYFSDAVVTIKQHSRSE